MPCRPLSAGLAARSWIRANTMRSASLLGKRRQQHVVNHAEDRRRRADAQSQRDDRHRRESPALPQHAQRVPQVVPPRLDRGERLQRSAVLLQQGGVAELPSRGAAASSLDIPCATNLSASSRTCSWISSSNPSSRCCLPRNTAQLRRERSQPRLSTCPHTYPSSCSSRSTRPITSEMRSQFSVSTSSCFRPRLVME